MCKYEIKETNRSSYKQTNDKTDKEITKLIRNWYSDLHICMFRAWKVYRLGRKQTVRSDSEEDYGSLAAVTM
jgi:hypothetical protein